MKPCYSLIAFPFVLYGCFRAGGQATCRATAVAGAPESFPAHTPCSASPVSGNGFNFSMPVSPVQAVRYMQRR